MFRILLLLASLSLTGLPQTKRCPCERYQPIGGGTDAASSITYPVTKRPVKKIEGSVRARVSRGESSESTIARIHVYRKSGQSYPFVAACETGIDGMFCFDDLPAATYLVCAENQMFSPECTVVTLKPRLNRSVALKFTLSRLPI